MRANLHDFLMGALVWAFGTALGDLIICIASMPL